MYYVVYKNINTSDYIKVLRKIASWNENSLIEEKNWISAPYIVNYLWEYPSNYTYLSTIFCLIKYQSSLTKTGTIDLIQFKHIFNQELKVKMSEAIITIFAVLVTDENSILSRNK